MKLIWQVWEDIRRGENIDLYVAVPLAIAIAILGRLKVVRDQNLYCVPKMVFGMTFSKENFTIYGRMGASGVVRRKVSNTRCQ
jgi:hypothetical protein